MKKILLMLFLLPLFAKAQFPSTDSLHRYTNRFITNSAINAFTDYRLNTELHGIINWIDSAKLGTGGSVGMDTAYMINDSTFRYRKNSVFHSFTIRGVGSTATASNGLTAIAGLVKLGGNLNQSITTINARNLYSVLWDSSTSWVIRDAPGTTSIDFNYANPSIQLNTTNSVFLRIRPDALYGSATNGHIQLSTDSLNLAHSSLITLNGGTIKIRNIGSSSDTTTYKPVEMAADGTIRRGASWFGGGGADSSVFATQSYVQNYIASLPADSIQLYRVAGKDSIGLRTVINGVTTASLMIKDSVGGGGGGLDQLTGDVTAGPGTGSQVATIANNAVTTAKINNNAVTLGKMATGTANRLIGYDGSGNAAIVAPGTGISIGSGTISSTGNPTLYVFTQYGGVNDGVFWAYGGTTTASSSTITCTKCTFTSGDVGKAFRIDSAKTGGLGLVGTFTAFIDSHHMTMSVTAANAVTKDIVYGTDNTAALQNLYNLVYYAGGGTIYAPKGIYIYSGSLQTSFSTVSGNVNPNAQIVLPIAQLADTSFNRRTTVTLMGETAPEFLNSYGADSVISHEGTTFETIIDGSGRGPALFGTSAVNGGGGVLNYNLFNFSNIRIVVPQNAGAGGGPPIGAVNCFYCSASQYDNFFATIEHNIYSSSNPTNDVAAVVTNELGSELMSFARNSSVAGFRFGWVFSDHFQADNCQISACRYGAVPIQNGYVSEGPKFSIQWCTWDIYAPTTSILGGLISPGDAFFNSEMIQGEQIVSGGAWYQNVGFLLDSSNHLKGSLTYQTNHDGSIVKYNGANMIMNRIGEYANFPTPNTRTFTIGDASTTTTNVTFNTNTASNNDVLVLSNTSANALAINNIHFYNDQGTGTSHGTYLSMLSSAQGGDFNSASRWFNEDGALYMGASATRIAYFGSAGIQFGTNAVKPGASAFLDITSTTQGFLQPRMTTTQKNAISSPAEGLSVYDNTLHLPYYHNGSAWVPYSLWSTSGSDINYSAGKVVVGAFPSAYAPLTINKSFTSGKGNFEIRDPSNAGGNIIAYQSFVDNTDTRVGLFGFGQYAGAPDPNFYYVNEQSSGAHVWRNGSSELMRLTNGNSLLIGSATDNSTGIIQSTTTSQNQLALHYDASHKATFGVSSAGDLTVTSTANLRLAQSKWIFNKSDGTANYVGQIAGSQTYMQFGYSRDLSLSGGTTYYIDTFNNFSTGIIMPTSNPNYSNGGNLYTGGTLQIGGGLFARVINITSNTTIDFTGNVYTIDATGGSVTITLPAASAAFGNGLGIQYIFKRTDASVNTITIQRAGSDTIDGATNFTLVTQYQVQEIIANTTSTWIKR